MKIVLDTNVLASGIFWSRLPAKILLLWHEQNFSVCITPEIFKEYTRIIHTLTKKYPSIDGHYFLEFIALYAKIFPDIKLQHPISRDPDDDKFIACALNANANIIVSGDKDLLDIKNYKDIEIMTPKNFLIQLNSQ